MTDKKDVTREVAALIFKVDPDKTTSEQRREARKANFGALFGSDPTKLVKPEPQR